MDTNIPLLGKLLVAAGLVIAGLGLALVFADKIPFLGRLPGDIHVKKDNVEFYFPLASSILVSVVLSVAVWVVSHFIKK